MPYGWWPERMVLLTIVSAVAGFIPATQASRIDPISRCATNNEAAGKSGTWPV
jgi:hypothetical protein